MLKITCVVGFILMLAGCSATAPVATGPVQVGPGGYQPLGQEKHAFDYASSVYLDLAIPVFDPGFPIDSQGNIDNDEVFEQNIWPQVRRTEAKRFAVDTQRALSQTQAFGKINVTPTPNTNADVFVLGKIVQSDSRDVEIAVTLVAATGEVIASDVFAHRVSPSFYRDALNADKDPYGPVFEAIARFVFEEVVELTDSEKQNIKQVAELRYAAVYSPERFGSLLEVSTKRSASQSYFQYEAIGLPANNDPMLAQINAIKAQEMMFVDNLQDNFAVFQAQTDDAYRTYQRETLPIIGQIEKQKAKRTRSQIASIGLAAAAILLNKNSNSTAGQVATAVAGIAAVSSVVDAVQSNQEVAKHRNLFEEVGENLDIELSPQVIEFNQQEVELTGTASEQYQQYKAYLREIYELDATPDTQL